MPFSFPIPLFSSYCARMERSTTKVIDMDFLWFDSMKRSEEGTMKWQWGLHVALTGTAVVPPALKWHDWKHSGDAPAGTWKVPLSLAWPHLVPNWPKCPFFLKKAGSTQQQSGLNHDVEGKSYCSFGSFSHKWPINHEGCSEPVLSDGCMAAQPSTHRSIGNIWIIKHDVMSP